MGSGEIYDRLRRVTTSGKFISEIDGLRFVAITFVVLFHINAHPVLSELGRGATVPEQALLLGVFRQGFHGVHLFFIISGFILALPFASHHLKGTRRVSLRGYFLRRVTRLEPPYVISMIALFAAAVAVKGVPAADLWPRLLASLGYVHNVIYGAESLVNGVAWSLEIEIQFYLLVPLLTAVFAIREKAPRRAVIALVALLAVAAQWLVVAEHRVLSLTVLNYLQFFMIGFLLADVFLADWNERPAKRAVWDLVSLAGWPLLFLLWNTAPAGAMTLLFPALAFLLYTAVFRGPVSNRLLTTPWITTVGGMCYTIYLFHNFLIGETLQRTRGFLPDGPFALAYLLQSAAIIPVILAASALYFLLIERPCMDKRWPRRLLARLGGPGAPAPAALPDAEKPVP